APAATPGWTTASAPWAGRRGGLGMANHDLKILRTYFEPVVSGKKPFEIRRNDRGFQEGDTVRLQEVLMDVGGYSYTGREVSKRITYVTDFEQRDDFVVFGLGDL
ncbi:DUF3850 domain-containing protein, partial [Methylogaea oryzae]